MSSAMKSAISLLLLAMVVTENGATVLPALDPRCPPLTANLDACFNAANGGAITVATSPVPPQCCQGLQNIVAVSRQGATSTLESMPPPVLLDDPRFLNGINGLHPSSSSLRNERRIAGPVLPDALLLDPISLLYHSLPAHLGLDPVRMRTWIFPDEEEEDPSD
ncbi:hypothetical protein DKX38_021859 [Salix brachista]|uniref:Bifunctional inhibitor/plant lipid transfer protein/seed storage helical domain-containing protein n=1 Tax=Salix brachista TaxID=2182728 RepID=A0A5N5K354_9ROSI|nr:hypothetical protein DKX38_021859 [Salix brachista]